MPGKVYSWPSRGSGRLSVTRMLSTRDLPDVQSSCVVLPAMLAASKPFRPRNAAGGKTRRALDFEQYNDHPELHSLSSDSTTSQTTRCAVRRKVCFTNRTVGADEPASDSAAKETISSPMKHEVSADMGTLHGHNEAVECAPAFWLHNTEGSGGLECSNPTDARDADMYKLHIEYRYKRMAIMRRFEEQALGLSSFGVDLDEGMLTG